jgi:hypothetical protein
MSLITDRPDHDHAVRVVAARGGAAVIGVPLVMARGLCAFSLATRF